MNSSTLEVVLRNITFIVKCDKYEKYDIWQYINITESNSFFFLFYLSSCSLTREGNCFVQQTIVTSRQNMVTAFGWPTYELGLCECDTADGEFSANIIFFSEEIETFQTHNVLSKDCFFLIYPILRRNESKQYRKDSWINLSSSSIIINYLLHHFQKVNFTN